MSNANLLADLAVLMNRHGPDSREVKRFIRFHRGRREFFGLALLSLRLKKALAARRRGSDA